MKTEAKREPGSICEETMTACDENGEIVNVRFVNRKMKDVPIDSPKLWGFVLGPYPDGRFVCGRATQITAH